MTYDFELTLIKQDYENDSIGNQVPIEVETKILCGKKSVTRSEFYDAAARDLKPELVFVVHGYEYSGETVVEFEGDRYSVLRTYGEGFEEMELVCARVLADIQQEPEEGEADGGN